MQKKKSRLIRMSDIETEQVQWLWYPFIPYGKVSIIQGDPGEGKTSCAQWLTGQAAPLYSSVI